MFPAKGDLSSISPWFEVGNSGYRFVTTCGKSATDAALDCEIFGGKLASFETKSEMDDVRDLIYENKFNADLDYFWIGGFKKDGEWYWDNENG